MNTTMSMIPVSTIRFAAVALFLLLLSTTPALAVVCQSTMHDRYMDLAPTSGSAICDGSGSTPPSEQSVYAGLGYTQLQESNANETGTHFSISGVGGTSGTFTILDSDDSDGTDFYDLFGDVIVVFKFGNGGTEPDWMGYRIDDVFSADWEVFETDGSSVQALSHVSLYSGSSTRVPAPGVLALCGAGLLGLFAAGRRRRR